MEWLTLIVLHKSDQRFQFSKRLLDKIIDFLNPRSEAYITPDSHTQYFRSDILSVANGLETFSKAKKLDYVACFEPDPSNILVSRRRSNENIFRLITLMPICTEQVFGVKLLCGHLTQVLTHRAQLPSLYEEIRILCNVLP